MLREAGEEAHSALEAREHLTAWQMSQRIVSVYPEVLGTDVVNSAVAIRWLLAEPGQVGASNVPLFGPLDIIVKWGDDLTVPMIDETVFVDRHEPRQGMCGYAAKFRSATGLFPHIRGVDLTPGFGPIARGDAKGVAEVLNRSEYLLCYEPSAVAIEAALCGCPVLYVLSDYMSGVPNGIGVAADTLCAQEIARARATLPALLRWYAHVKQHAQAQVDRLIERVYEAL